MAKHPSPEEIAYMKAHIEDNRADGLIASHVICFTAACIAVGLRFVARRLGKVKYGLDVCPSCVQPLSSRRSTKHPDLFESQAPVTLHVMNEANC